MTMRIPFCLSLTLAALVAGLASADENEEAGEGVVKLAEFEVLQLEEPQPPTLNDPIDPEQLDAPAEEMIPEPIVAGGPPASFIDHTPVPYPFPGIHLWAGYCNHMDTLVPCPCEPAWASIDLLWLQRSNPDDYVLARHNDGRIELRNDNFSFDDEPGLRLVYGREICCTPVEFTYFGTHDWNSTIFAEEPGELDVPFAPLPGGAFEDADWVAANYKSELHSLELNIFRVPCDCEEVTWFGGVRLVNVDEKFRMWSEDVDELYDGYLAINTDNVLLGLQVGGLFERQCCAWRVFASGKAGGYLNFADGNLYAFDQDGFINPPFEFRASQDSTDLAFLGEINVGVSRHLFCGVGLRAGYQVTYITGLALAAEQLGATMYNAPQLNDSGNVLYDGGYLGLEWHR